MIHFLFHSANRNFLKLWFAQVSSQFADRVLQFALLTIIAARSPGSSVGLANLMVFTVLPVFFVQPIAGVLVDRWDYRKTLFLTDLGRGLLVLLIPVALHLSSSMILIYPIIFVVYAFSRFYIPAKLALIPDIVNEEDLWQANSLKSMTGMIAAVFGSMYGTFLIERFGLMISITVVCVSYLSACILLWWMKTKRQERGGEVVRKYEIAGPSDNIIKVITAREKGFMNELMEGIRYLFIKKEIRFIMCVFCTLAGALGAIYVVGIVYVQEVFSSITRDLGILAISFAAGLFVGVLIVGKNGEGLRWEKMLSVCMGLSGVMLILFTYVVAQFASIPLAVFVCGIWGVSFSPLLVAPNTIVHLVSDENMRAKVFSAFEVVAHFAFMLIMFVSAWLADIFGREGVLVAVGVICLLMGLVAYVQPGARSSENAKII